LNISDKMITTSKYYAQNSTYLIKYFKELAIVPTGVNVLKFNLTVIKGYLKKVWQSSVCPICWTIG